MKIYRSIICSRNNSNYPLKKVEIIEDDENFELLIYDIRFDPPFWDVTKIPLILVADVDSFKSVIKYLKDSKQISVIGWQLVDKPFLDVSNSIIRDEIRIDISEQYKNVGDKEISSELFFETFNFLYQNNGRNYGGQDVYFRALFQINEIGASSKGLPFSPVDLEVNPKLLSYESSGVFIAAPSSSSTRNSELIDKDRFIIKSTPEDTSFGCHCSPTGNPECVLYDQVTRSILHKAVPIKLIFNFHEKEEIMQIDSEGINTQFISDEMEYEIIID